MLDTTCSRAARTAFAAAVLAGSLLLTAACGTGTEATGASSSAGLVPAGVPAVAPAGTPVTATALPWPVRGASALSALQATADSGAQPWLLDPLELAQAYAAAAHGWPDAAVRSAGPGEIRISAGGAAYRLSVGQPVRTGAGGVWVVTGEQPA